MSSCLRFLPKSACKQQVGTQEQEPSHNPAGLQRQANISMLPLLLLLTKVTDAHYHVLLTGATVLTTCIIRIQLLEAGALKQHRP